MASPLFNLLADLASKPEVLEEFQAQSKVVMERYGIPAETIDELKTNQLFTDAVVKEMHKQLGGDPDALSTNFVLC